MSIEPERLNAALREAGLPEAGTRFSVAAVHQVVPADVMEGIETFLQVFERVTTRRAWREHLLAGAPEIARRARPEVCFFTAWDFHLPPEDPARWQLIECNDNGSGLLVAGLANDVYHALGGLSGEPQAVPPPDFAELAGRVLDLVEREWRSFFADGAPAGFLVLDDPESLASGRFRRELDLLCELIRRRGWTSALAAPGELRWHGGRLRCAGEEVRFVVNRSTDFFWEAEAFAALRSAYLSGSVYVAPNPFTYATRSDKCLLEPLSHPERDPALGIRPDERAELAVHVPETWRVLPERIDVLARRKTELVFKPAHGFAGRGLLPSDAVGRTRLRRIAGRGAPYVAQRRVPKRTLRVGGAELWTDLRVWAYRGEPYLVSGRGSRRPDRLDLTPPGGWLPTYIARG